MTLELVVRLWLDLIGWTPRARMAEPLRELAAAALFPRVGCLPIAGVRPCDLAGVLAAVAADPVTPGDPLLLRAALVEAFDLAVMFGWCQENVARATPPP